MNQFFIMRLNLTAVLCFLILVLFELCKQEKNIFLVFDYRDAVNEPRFIRFRRCLNPYKYLIFLSLCATFSRKSLTPKGVLFLFFMKAFHYTVFTFFIL